MIYNVLVLFVIYVEETSTEWNIELNILTFLYLLYWETLILPKFLFIECVITLYGMIECFLSICHIFYDCIHLTFLLFWFVLNRGNFKGWYSLV